MECKITTLTPVHIGSGERYNGLSYVIYRINNQNKLCYLEFDKIKQVLNTQQLQNFANYVTEERYPKIEGFLRNRLNDRNDNIKKNLMEKSVYKIDLLFIENPQQRRFLGDIDSFIKQNNKVYIPGSEIKGAIRTAIMYKVLNNKWDDLKNELVNFQNKFRETLSIIGSNNRRANYSLSREEINRLSENEKKLLFGKIIPDRIRISDIKKVLAKEIEKIEEELQKKVFHPENEKDAKYDLLKFLFVSDSESKKPDESIFVSEVKTLNMSTPRSSFREFLKTGQEFKIEINVENRNEILEKLRFSDYQKEILSIEKIFECCYEFANDLIEEEINYFRQNRNNNIVNKLNQIKNQNEKNSPVLRIGRDEGYLSLTVGLLVKRKDSNLYNNVLIHATKNTSYSGMFPKTRKVVCLGENNFDTIGWIKIKQEN
ncbi:MAG: type III-A CRISPR-associated RAMP protein Csm5 [Candidatus Aenigmatarchaeota archaeon]